MKKPGFGNRQSAFVGLGGLRGGVLAVSLGAAATALATGAARPAPDITTATVRALPPLPPIPAARAPQPAAPPLEPAMPASAPPGLRRCVRADGTSLFTDRRCDLMEARPDGLPAGEPPAPRAATPAPQVVRVRSCARTQGDLLEGVRMALEARDPNRFAEFYHWTEMGNAEGYQLAERLARFTERPLVDVQLVTDQERVALESPGWATRAPAPAWFPRAPSDAMPPPAPPAPAPPPRPRFDLLRVDQLGDEGAFETRTTWFHLRSNAGCWWLQF